MTNVGVMEKNIRSKKTDLHKPGDKTTRAQEPAGAFRRSEKKLPKLKDFTYSEFRKIADQTPFTQAEWAAMLHVSERTLQRYAKNNGSFAPINAERAMQIANVLKEAIATFGNLNKFYNWIKREPFMLEGNLSFASLTSYDGILKVLTQLGRIQHGIFA